MGAEAKLKELGIELPKAATPLGSYVAAVRTGNLVYLSGQLPLVDGKLARTGKVGAELTAEEAATLARICAINALAALKAYIGSLDNVTRCVKLTGFVACTPDFTAQPKVINGASDLIAEVFGDIGRHSRAAVGAPVLPMNSPVEIEFIFEVRD